MLHNEEELDMMLEKAVGQIRGEEPPAGAVAEASKRVWKKLEAEGISETSASGTRIECCEDYQALIPDYLAGELPEARRLLVEDHTRSCIPCRKALTVARSGQTASAAETHVRGASWMSLPAVRWAAMTVLVLGLAFTGFLTVDHLVIRPGTVMASVEFVDGSLLRIGENGNADLAAGQEIFYGQPVRTAKGSRAVVRLEDGSLVELNERSEISLGKRRGDVSIAVTRGSVIVQAAKQGDGHLYAATDDCLVSVVGTVFSVTAGTKGSRVSVIEGEVHVDDGSGRHVLRPGDQVSTHQSLAAVPVADEIAWSGDVDSYLALLREISEVRQELMNAIRSPELRYDTDLLDLAPEGSIFYGGMPNVATSISESYGNVLTKIQESEMLSQWWQENVDTETESQMRDAIDRLHDFGQYFGAELVVAAQIDPNGVDEDGEGFVLLAKVDRPAAFRAFLEEQIAQWDVDGERPVSLVADPADAIGEDTLWLWVDDGGLMAASTEQGALQQVADVYRGGVNGFVGTEFHQLLADSYDRGAGWVFGVNMESVINGELADDPDRETLDRAGITDVRHVLIERKPDGEGTLTEAVVTFGDERRGVASWLAEPAPMGSLEYVSTDARFAAASVFKDPAGMLEDLFGIVELEDPEFWQGLAEFEAETGLSIYDDIAAPLGGEMTIALDGPIFPQPAWKVIVEVYDPATLQATLGRIVERMNVELAEHDVEVNLTEETVGAHTYYTLSSNKSPQDLCYTYDDGYLVGSPNRVLTEQALAIRASGFSLTDSQDFIDRLPRSSHADFSALVYSDLGQLMGHAASLLGGVAETLSPEQQSQIQALMESSEPSLYCAYGESDRVVIASVGNGGGWMNLSLGAFLGAGAGVGLEELLAQAAGQGI